MWLSEGDTPTKKIHCHANACRRKNMVGSLEHQGQVLVQKESKAEVAFRFFDDILGTTTPHLKVHIGT
jgi:hypothetical protein